MNFSELKWKGLNRRILPLVLQEEIGECGQACIAMMACFWGHSVDLAAIRARTLSSHHGMNLERMDHVLKSLSLEMRPMRMEAEHVAYLKTPVILHWQDDHYVVLKKINRFGAVIYDPAVGVCRYTQKKFLELFSGIVIEVCPSISFHALSETYSLRLVRFIKLIPGLQKGLMWLFFLSILVELLHLISPLYVQYMIDRVIVVGEKENLMHLIIAFVLLGSLQSILGLFRQSFIIYLKMNWIEKFSSFAMKHLLRLPLSFFQLRHKGDLQSKFGSIDEIQRKIGVDFITTILDGGMVLLSGMVMVLYSPKLTLLSLFVLSFYFLIRYIGYLQLSQSMMISLKKHAEVASFFLESLHSMMTIKVFGKENQRFIGWRRGWIDALNVDIQNERRQVFLQQFGDWIAQMESIASVALGAMGVLNHSLSLGMLLAFLSYREMLVSRSYSLIHHWIDYRLIKIPLARVNDILAHSKEDHHDQTQAFFVPDTKGHLRLDHLAFRYELSLPCLFESFSLDIAPGEKVAIVGPSGCGKSTLLKLMMGLLNPTRGEIYFDDYPLSLYGMKRYREGIAAVLQDDILLSGSILENIIFFEEVYDLSEVMKASKMAAIHDTIMQWPLQYQTRIGDMGSTLSGGQKQRVLLARALYKKPKILFLDEATSHLDVIHEQSINHALSELNITQVIVAHRQETIQMADRVVCLK